LDVGVGVIDRDEMVEGVEGGGNDRERGPEVDVLSGVSEG